MSELNQIEEMYEAQPSLMLQMHDAMHSEEGSTTKGFLVGAGVGAGGLALALTLMKTGMLPSFHGETHVTDKPSNITMTFDLNEGCASGFDTDSGAESTVQLHAKSGSLLGHVGIHFDQKIPGTSMGSEVSGTVRTEVCQTKATDVPAVYNSADKSLVVTIPNSSVVFKANMLPETRIVKEHSGALVVPGEIMAKWQQLITDRGLPNSVDRSHSILASMAEMEADQNVVEHCAEKVAAVYQEDLTRYNKDDFVSKAKTFGVEVAPDKITVHFEGAAPSYNTQYAEALQSIKTSDVELKTGKAADCTVSPNVANDIQQATGVKG